MSEDDSGNGLAPGRAARGITAGALTGSVGVTGYFIGQWAWQWLTAGYPGPIGVSFNLFIAAVSALIWAAGLTLIAAPIWYFLHRAGMRGWIEAVALGFGLAFLARVAVAFSLLWASSAGTAGCQTDGCVMQDWQITWFGLKMIVSDALGFGVLGVVVGWVTWRVAYPADKRG